MQASSDPDEITIMTGILPMLPIHGLKPASPQLISKSPAHAAQLLHIWEVHSDCTVEADFFFC